MLSDLNPPEILVSVLFPSLGYSENNKWHLLLSKIEIHRLQCIKLHQIGEFWLEVQCRVYYLDMIPLAKVLCLSYQQDTRQILSEEQPSLA